MERYTVTTPGGSVIVEADVKHITMPEITATFAVDIDESLRGERIHVGAASRKYSVPHGTISRWISSGYIRIIERKANTLEVDEGDIALVAAIYHAARKITTPERAGWLLKRAMQA